MGHQSPNVSFKGTLVVVMMKGKVFLPSLDHSKNVSKYKIDYFSHSHVFHLPRGLKKNRAMQINRLKTWSEIH